MRYLKKVVVVLLTVVILLDLLAIVFSLFVRNRFLNEKVYFEVLKNNGLYSFVKSEASKELREFVEEKNIKGLKLEEYIDESFVETNINRLIYGFIDYLTKTEDAPPRISLSLDKELINKADDYYKEQEKTLSDVEIKALEKLGSELNSVVEEKINFTLFQQLEKNEAFIWGRDIVSNLYRNLNLYIFILLAGLSILFFMTNYQGFKILAAQLFVVGIILAVLFYTLYYAKYFSLIKVDEAIIRNSLIDLLNNFSLFFANSGLFILVLSIPVYGVYRFYKNR